MGIKEFWLNKLGEVVVSKIKELDKHEVADFVRSLFVEHAAELLNDTDDDGKSQIENAMDEVEQGFEHFQAAARIIHGVEKQKK